ncbi:RHS repeat-associated core domain-containing protein [Elizabethkingia anophelis]|uniref:RHS repeat-associated core domain-containing protein n=1 Tax=Elizabethkingia anophelis TaxID=1117645 RepID=UPI000994CE8F|nr:RHS repeat-associated core domain-containing protein [Elizabethkingia anophelis]AQW93062.1 hypothetical protein BBD30_02090 [Elizabethkingia anophelis]OPB61123.1 hypothetical protein BAS07_01520 [Elizabethkingia anophelis]
MTTIEAKVCTEYYSAGSSIIRMYATIKVPDTFDIATGKYRLMNGDTIIRESSYHDYSRVNGEIVLSAMFDNELTEQELSQATKFVWDATLEGISTQLVLEGYNSVRCATGTFTNPEITTPVGTIGNIPFHDTTGQIDVNGGGQLQYTLPIALPPGIKSVAPQINLVYTSGSGNGIAGYGFNLSGISAISRTGKTIEKDGETKGIQLDYSDFYQFNGQRLILKSGEYGKDGAQYLTEKYSNIKIKSVGTNLEQTGPSYFEVTFEDGSQAWYGLNADARTPLEYNITRWQDPQGNYISYNYIQGNNVSIINNIEWGGNETAETSHFNNIAFNYVVREAREISYVNGKEFIQANILSEIIVTVNDSIFKKYSIIYKKDDKGNLYQFVEKIIESNAKGEQANPAIFKYEESKSGVWKSSYIRDDKDTDILYGDFDGDGKLDIIKYNDASMDCLEYDTRWVPYNNSYDERDGFYETYCKVEEPRPGGLYLYSSVFDDDKPKEVYTGSLGITKEQLKNAKAVNIKKLTGELLPRQGFVTYKTLITNGLGGKKDLEFKAYSIDVNSNNKALVEEFTKVVPGSSYDRSIPRPTPQHGVNRYWVETYIEDGVEEIDLDGDGISELIFRLRDVSFWEEYLEGPNSLPEERSETRFRYLIVQLGEIDPNKMASSFPIGPFYNENFFKTAKRGDFNGDGIVDFLYFDGGGRSYLATFKRDVNGLFYMDSSPYSDMLIEGVRTDAVVGDFNGDGKTDLLVPQGEDSWNWKLYISTGKGFKVQNLNGFALFKKKYEGYGTYIQRNFYAQDLNKDGKADFIEFYSYAHSNNSGTDIKSKFLIIYHENKGTDANGNIIFEEKNIDGHSEIDPRVKTALYASYEYPFAYTIQTNGQYDNRFTAVQPYATSNKFAHYQPSIGDFRINNFNENILVIQQGRLIRYSYYKVADEARIISITQGGLTTDIDYKELDPNINGGFYGKVKERQYLYPYVEMDKVSQSYAVFQLRQEGRKQDFKYRGLTAHLLGKGMIGFQQCARSSWYADGYENTKIWSGTEIDPVKDGVPVKEWTVRTIDNIDLIFPADISINNSQLLSFKSTDYQVVDIPVGIKAIIPIKTITKDFLKNVTEQSAMIYDEYFLPSQTTVKINETFATKTSIMTYLHNPTGEGKDYYIGRPTSKTETVAAYGDTKSKKEEYIYLNNLVKKLKTYNRDNTGWVQESYDYDSFGNTIEKTVSNSEDNILKNQKSLYDAKGRFVEKKTDNLELDTVITYNFMGQVLTQTDSLGNVITNTYDSWGKMLTSKTNLGGMITYTYEKLVNGNTKVTQYAPDGVPKETYTNKLGLEYKVRTRGQNCEGVIRSSGGLDYLYGERKNTYISKSTNFDILGRKTGESEAYFDNENPRWNTLNYDDSVFPTIVIATAFNGKQLKTSVSGMTEITEELTGNKRITKKITDAMGNVISSEDKGGVINFSFNAAGEQVSVQYANNIITTEYDSWGRKSRFHDPSNGVYTYEYNGFGQVTKEISPKGYKEYAYDTKGQLVSQIEKSTTTGLTNKNITISYNNQGQLTGKTGVSNGKNYATAITYDLYGRLMENSEISNGRTFVQKNIVYDHLSRIASYEKGVESDGTFTKIQIENVYDPWSGKLYKIRNNTNGNTLWELQNANAKGQVIWAKLGASNIENIYDDNDFLSKVEHRSINALLFGSLYTFDSLKNELTERTRQGNLARREVFTYDDNNRLLQWTNPRTGGFSSNIYDAQGRITVNDQIGTVYFGTGSKMYQPASVVLNTTGQQNYSNDLIQKIIYNENNDPLYIDGQSNDVRFAYGLTNMRQMATYGGEAVSDSINDMAASNWEGQFTKYYNEDGSIEIIHNNTTGEEKHILYVGGTPYESNILYLKDFEQSSGSYKFLHKDYLGSILAVSDEEGNLIEERHFDAWGQFTHLKIKNGSVNTSQSQILNSHLIVDRGYTSHEHFMSVGIIHMNGRLYDPLLRRFLNADENIQNPYNTQNYNKYGYVINNPLMYKDPNGEFFFLFLAAWGLSAFWATVATGAILGAAIGLAAYSIGAAITGGKWNLGGALRSMFWGAVGGAVTAGIGNAFSTAASNFQAATEFAKTTLGVFTQAGAHAVAQGVLSLMQGGTFQQAFLSAALGSLGASSFGKIAGNWAGKAGGQVFFGALSGGVGAVLTGGNFWQGAVIGGVVAGLNHVMHEINNKAITRYVFKSANVTGNPSSQENLLKIRDAWADYMSKNGLKASYEKISFEFIDNLSDTVDGNIISVSGKTFLNSDVIQLNSNIKSETSIYQAGIIGHEMFHYYDFQNNYYSFRASYNEHGAGILMEWRAYNFIKSMGIDNPTWTNQINSLGKEWINFLKNQNPGMIKALEIK